MKRLYKCQLDVELIVYAEDEDEAINLAQRHVVSHVANGVNDDEWDVFESKEISKDWLGAHPYNGDKTCKQLLMEIEAEEIAEAESEREKAEFEAHPKLIEV